MKGDVMEQSLKYTPDYLIEAAIKKAREDEKHWDASLGGAGLACFLTSKEQTDAIEGSRLKVVIAQQTVKFLKAELKKRRP